MTNLFNQQNWKVLTLWQPWATLVVYGIKLIETRPGPTSWTADKGKYLIHAAKKLEAWQIALCFKEPFKSSLEKIGVLKKNSFTKFELPTGQIIGAVEVQECGIVTYNNIIFDYSEVNFPSYLKYTIEGLEYSFGDYSTGRYAWLLKNPQVLKEPIPYKGGQGYYQNFKGDVNKLIFI